uniref:ThiF family adenylyltransferase n=1 Tax=Neorhizobium sp. EC2-8 TaxID=3129230 RepID=UPI003101316C
MKAIDYHAELFDAIHDTDFVIIGCENLAAQIAAQLAALGAQRFFLVDRGRIEGDSLKRLSWIEAEDIGRSKSDRLATYLAAHFSAVVAITPESADEAEAARLVLDRARKPFLVLAEDDVAVTRRFLMAYHAAAQRPSPYLHVDHQCGTGLLVAGRDDACVFCGSSFEGAVETSIAEWSKPAQDALIACLAVSQIVIQCFTRSSPSGQSWIFEPGLSLEARS